MTFLNPLVLLGLVAAAIPLLIHLFNFRRPKRVEFSSLAFLREVQRSTMQRVRIKQWLLLLLRTLAIAALVLAFARPSIRGSLAEFLGSTAPTAIAVIVDDSASMDRRDAAGAYFDQAVAAAEAIAQTTDQRDEVFLLTTSGADEGGSIPGGAQAADRVSRLRSTLATGTAEAAIRRAVRMLDGSDQPNTELWLVSDLQASTLVDSAGTPGAEADRVGALRVVPVGTRVESNVAIEDVRIVSRIVESGQPVRIEADLVNYSASPAAGYSVGIESGGVRLAQTSIDMLPGERVTASFVVTPQVRGWLSATVVTEDDAFPTDNVFHFTLLVPESRRILLVAGEGVASTFVETALSERLTGAGLRFDVTRIPERALPSTNLTDFDVVILSGPTDLSTGEVDRVARFVADGGGLLWYPGRDARIDDYNALLAALGGGRVSGWSEGGAEGRPVDTVDRFEREHPLFDGMFDGREGDPERPVLYRRMNYLPSSSTETTLMHLAGGSPFLQELRSGRGDVLLLTSAPDPDWSDLPTRGLFLPLLYRSIFLLSSTGTVAGEHYVIGRPGQLYLPGVSEAQRIEIEGPGGAVSAPVMRSVAGGALLTLDGWLSEPGSYVVRADGSDLYRFAVNPDPRESGLAGYEPDEAASKLSERTGLAASVVGLDPDQERARDVVTAERRGVELWNVFLIIALLCMVTETAVAAFWKPEAAG